MLSWLHIGCYKRAAISIVLQLSETLIQKPAVRQILVHQAPQRAIADNITVYSRSLNVPHKALSSWPWKMAAINKVSLGHLGRREIWTSWLSSPFIFCATTAECGHLLPHTLSPVKNSVTNGFSIRVICIKLQMKSTIALTLCHAQLPPPPRQIHAFLFTMLDLMIYCRARE